MILVVGVNGSGKTTTIGKLARRCADEGSKVMLAAGDTFRAAAIEQLKVWGERNDVPVIAQATGADPAAVDLRRAAVARRRAASTCSSPTPPGRLHTQSALMDELKKVRRVLGAARRVGAARDAARARREHGPERDRAGASSSTRRSASPALVITKLDGTAKGGVVLAIADALRLPIRYIGVGEQAEDLDVFDAEQFVDARCSRRRSAATA